MGLRLPTSSSNNSSTSNHRNNNHGGGSSNNNFNSPLYPPVMRKRSRSGSPTFFVSSSEGFPNSGRISQRTLQRIFIAMMTVAFGTYVIFTAYLLQLHHNEFDPTASRGKWGPSSLLQDDQILKAHIQRLQKLRDERLLTIPDNTINKTTMGTGRGKTRVQVNVNRVPVSPKFILEEVDIHDMRHPKEIQKQPNIKTTTDSAAVQPKSLPKVSTHSTMNTTHSKPITLKAYLEPINLQDWDVKPLPVRQTTRDQLQVIEYPRVNSCSRLPEQWPIDDFPNADPFLP